MYDKYLFNQIIKGTIMKLNNIYTSFSKVFLSGYCNISLIPIFFKISLILSILSLTVLSCDRIKVKPTQQLDKPPVEIISIDPRKNQPVDLAVSQLSPIQANQSGLYVTPAHCKNDSILFRLINNPRNFRNLQGVLARGESANQSKRILFSTKSVQGDSLIFYPGGPAKLLIIGSDSNISQMDVKNKYLNLIGYSFAYNSNHLTLSIEPLFKKNYLVSIINTRTGETVNVFPPRVPHDFEPAERNHITSMTAVPGGVVFSFTGDRKIYHMNYKGQILRKIVLGKSDPIPTPFTTQEPDTLKRSSSYIKKMDYENQFLHVLMDNQIWLVDLKHFKPITRLQFTNPVAQENYSINDFSISGNKLYLKEGDNSFTQIYRKKSWYALDKDNDQLALNNR